MGLEWGMKSPALGALSEVSTIGPYVAPYDPHGVARSARTGYRAVR